MSKFEQRHFTMEINYIQLRSASREETTSAPARPSQSIKRHPVDKLTMGCKCGYNHIYIYLVYYQMRLEFCLGLCLVVVSSLIKHLGYFTSRFDRTSYISSSNEFTL